MPKGSLTPLQHHVLFLLGRIEPRWRLSGGGALVGFHAHHRTTRDLDLFWPPVEHFDEVVATVERTLEDAGLRVERVQTARTFARRTVSDGGDTCLADLAADSATVVDPSGEHDVGGVAVLVDSAQEILTNKLCALLSCSEWRDLVDARWLVEHGADLARAVREAPEKDASFSAPTLAWVLQGTELGPLARAAGVDDAAAEEIARWRDRLVGSLVRMSRP